MIKERRLGNIYITQELIEDGLLPELIKQLKFVPYEISYRLYMGDFKYTGKSPFFKELQEGEAIPDYTVIMEQTYFKVDRA